MVGNVFRRRTTDQVYATLQQVQRRISEASPAPTAPSYGAKVMPTAPAIRPTPLPIPRTPLPGDGALSGPATAVHPAPVPLVPPAGGRAVIQLPVSLAITLGVVLIVICIAFFVIGQYVGKQSAGGSPAVAVEQDDDPPPKPVAERPKAAGQLLLLKTIPSATAADKAKWDAEVKRLNGIMVANGARGWKPLFALREPPSGHLQLVFGKEGERWGVEREAWLDFQKIMVAPTTSNGAGYTSASWIPAE
jgi:hypothetical protein